MRILLVEDDPALAEAVSRLLRRDSYQVDIASDGEEGYRLGTSEIYDLLILDIMLPVKNGIDVMRDLRGDGISTPVLMLSARAEVGDRVAGLDAGADDYLPKPFYTEELLARVRALVRRKDQDIRSDDIHIGDVILDKKTMELRRHERAVRLTAKEYELFQYLCLREGMITSKDQIIDKLWGFDGEADGNNVEVYVSFLRKKLKFLETTVSIRTHRNIGYAIEP